MKTNILIILTLVISFCVSCEKDQSKEWMEEYPEDCAGYSAGIYKVGYAYAEGSYRDFGEYAIFARERMVDTITGWKHDPKQKGITMTAITNCSEKMMIIISNIEISPTDTILLKYSNLGLSKEYPTASLHYMDADAAIEDYHLVAGADNWIIIDKINSDTTEIEGRFNLSFVTAYDFYLNGERQRWDDPNRPNVLHFTNENSERCTGIFKESVVISKARIVLAFASGGSFLRKAILPRRNPPLPVFGTHLYLTL